MAIAASGTAWHAGLVAKYALEELAKLPVEFGLASELCYGDTPFDPETLTIAVSQSGETADTLAAVRMAQEAGSKVFAVTKIRGSSLPRDAARRLLADALTLPAKVREVLANDRPVIRSARRFMRGHDFMYIGRRYNLATAYEGALKMKEISYLHAEGYGAGEMKHGPLALVDRRMTVVAVAPQGRVTEKMLSNMQEVHARHGRLIAVTTKGVRVPIADETFAIPACEEMWSPVLAVIPLQLLAYHTAVGLDRDVDQPRNLAKSVTVE